MLNKPITLPHAATTSTGEAQPSHYLLQKVLRTTSWIDLTDIAESLQSPTLWKKFQCIVAEEILASPPSKIESILTHSLAHLGTVPNFDLFYNVLGEPQQHSTSSTDKLSIRLDFPVVDHDDAVQTKSYTISQRNWTVWVKQQHPTHESPTTNNCQTELTKLLNKANSVVLTSIKQLGIFAQSDVSRLVRRLGAKHHKEEEDDDVVAPLTLCLNGTDVGKEIDMLLRRKLVSNVSRDHFSYVLQILDDLWEIQNTPLHTDSQNEEGHWCGVETSFSIPSLEILTQMDPSGQLVRNLLDLMDTDDSDIPSILVSHLSSRIGSDWDQIENGLSSRSYMADVLMKIVLCVMESGDDAVLPSFVSYSNGWKIISNLESQQRACYLKKMIRFESRQREVDLYWTEWFIHAFCVWVREQDGADHLFIQTMFEEDTWSILCENLYQLEIPVIQNRLQLLEEMNRSLLSHSNRGGERSPSSSSSNSMMSFDTVSAMIIAIEDICTNLAVPCSNEGDDIDDSEEEMFAGDECKILECVSNGCRVLKSLIELDCVVHRNRDRHAEDLIRGCYTALETLVIVLENEFDPMYGDIGLELMDCLETFDVYKSFYGLSRERFDELFYELKEELELMFQNR